MNYKQLTFEQRYSIELMLKAKISKKEIIKSLCINESTFYRELKRNSKPRTYSAKHAQKLADERKKEGHYKTIFSTEMKKIIKEKMIKFQWSPEQIVGWCKLKAIQMVSHERIYQYVWQDKRQGGLLYKELRTGQKKYKKRYGSKSNRGQIPDKVSIEKRPKIVELKERVGDLESDLIIGKDHKGALLTIVDRYSSFLWIENVTGKKADMITKMTINTLAPHKKWVRTITNDNGKEFAGHKKIAEKLNCDVYFAHPYSSWERGLNEYTNKLIRQYFPKNEHLDNVKQKDIFETVNKLNNRPRKKLGYRTPKEVFYQFINQNQKLALGT
ncbi:IS30 family transposase [Polaribacter batillariae]|uniref:IS30 family transposase n=1 Tax=Polaribacter batillariae TaxID=2808900 RepID=A0ABX7SR59_9FLAO|nr:IS30 family transposase [Polaribacter batillariae]QTD36353.1 IS30 family transposase [Polaribacter batillariae]QTD36364.1 IS30 family transposase [Polaribacter batillariae]QTD36626.1 IS30 family transposase [Polaribacter batillariae]QTD37605.1 IS30 family transposase [Polaribacter batillariae]QTD37682.1 IS30 family transposase [Polaribacter batillariae]